jgi:hypothetical protein
LDSERKKAPDISEKNCTKPFAQQLLSSTVTAGDWLE